MKTGIVDVGGGMRGIYAAGVLDWYMDHGITFDVGVGVSAGSANLASFTAKQPRRNFRFYSEYALLQQAFNLGCDKVVLLLTLPENTVRTSDTDRKLARGIRRKYPVAAKMLEQRAQRYNDGVALARRYAGWGKLLIVAPDDTCGVQTLTRDADALKQLYEKGYQDGRKIETFLQQDLLR